jgi:hypothetical protein
MDQKRADKVFSLLYRRHEAKLEPYDKPIVQDVKYMPKGMVWGSREHSLYLFFLCIYMKGGIISSVAIINLSRLYEAHPEIFLPENLLGFEDHELEWVIEWLGQKLREYGLGVNVEESKMTWVWNSQKLAKYWDSDPRKIFVRSDEIAEETWHSYEAAKANFDALGTILMRKNNMTHEEFKESPNGFYGFRHKMVSMIIYFYDDAGIIKRIPYPLPVDFHILRVFFATGILKMKKNKKRKWRTHRWDYRERFLPYAREVALRYVVETKADPRILAECPWILSKTWCVQHPGNSSSVDKVNRARRRYITDLPVVWNEKTERRYDRTCGRCPVEHLCEWNIPSAYYYVKGAIVLRSRRAKPHQLKLLDVQVITPSNGNGHKSKKVLPVLVEIHPSFFD